ncbi:hypothetical protein M0804_009581 [Polistes exclamans]|nr:hypothetical protein M0804_009581 [Polistes exclamans]
MMVESRTPPPPPPPLVERGPISGVLERMEGGGSGDGDGGGGGGCYFYVLHCYESVPGMKSNRKCTMKNENGLVT